MQFVFINQTNAAVDEKALEDFLKFSLAHLPESDQTKVATAEELTIVFVAASEMQKLNQQFRGKDKPTDILSFTGIEESSLGELILCADVIEHQAKDHKLTATEETCYMLIHGILHLLGYDHENDDTEAERMYRLQDNIFNEYFGD